MKRPLALALTAGLTSAIPALGQQTFTEYQGPSPGAWSSSGFWSHGVPNNVGGQHWVPIILSGRHVVHNISAAVDKIGIQLGSQITVANNTTLTVLCRDANPNSNTGLISSEGVLHLDSTGHLTNLVLSGPPGSYVITGHINLAPSWITMSNHINNRIYGANGVEEFVVDVSAQVEGSGQVGVNAMSLENRGTIRATGSAGLVVDPNAAGVENSGALIAEGGTLTLQNGVFTQIGEGGVRAFDGSNVVLSAATLRGGSFASNSGGRLDMIASSVVEDFVCWNQINVPNNNTAHLRGTLAFAPDGFLSISSVAHLTNLVVLDGDAAVTGPGDIVLGNHFNNRIYSDNAARRLVLDDQAVIRGSGQLGVNAMALTVEQGTGVVAEGSTGLVVDPNAAGVDNNGVMRAAAASQLTLQNGLFDNVQGTIEVIGDGHCRMLGAMIAGGVLSGPATSGFSLESGSELASVTNSGWILVPNNNTSFLSGTINNASGEVRLGSVSHLTNLLIRGDVQLSGGGVVSMSDHASNRIYAEGGAARLTNQNNTIRGSGQLGVNAMALTNNGVIEAVGSVGLVVDPNASGAENNGVLRAASGSTLTLANGTFDNTDGEVQVVEGGTCVISLAKVAGGDFVGPSTGGFVAQGGSELADVSNAGFVTVPNNNSVFLSGTTTNAGTLAVASVSHLTNLQIRGPVTLAGAGALVLTNHINNRIYAENGLDRLTNASTIRGAGQLGVNAMALTNEGLIEAVGSAGLFINPNTAGADNIGTIRAAGGSFLTLTDGVFDNAGGLLEVAADGGGAFQGAKIVGGTITSAPGTAFALQAGSELAGVTNTGTIDLPNNNACFVSGVHQNAQGTLKISSVSHLTNLLILGETTLSGHGALVMSNHVSNRIYAANNADRLINDVGHTIRGGGQIGVNLMAFTNKGSVIADQSAGLTIDPNADGFDNQGLLRAQAGTITINAGPFATSGAVVADAGRLINRAAGDWVQTGGSVTANGEVQVVSNVYLLQGGTLGGSGIVDSNVTNSGGVVVPGNSPGTLTIQGTYTQQTGGAMTVEIGGTVAGTEHDQLAVTGAVSLAGALNVNTLGGFAPTWNQVFTILTGSSVTGTFGTVNTPTLPAGSLKVIYGPMSVKVGVCMADCNASGTLTIADFGCFQSKFAQGDPYADCNGNGTLTIADFGCFQSIFAAGCPQ